MKFIKKPIPVEAVQWTGGNTEEIMSFMNDNQPYFDFWNSIIIQTLEGEMKAPVGSWIIRGPKGEYYPCRRDIFEETYERIDE